MFPGGSFWSSWRSSQSIENLLSRSDLSLSELLDEEDVIQEVRNQNAKLIAFLNTDRLRELLVYVTEEPAESDSSKRCHKYPFVACEIFSCEVTPIMQKLVDDQGLLDKVFSVLKTETIHPTLAGYFSKVFVSLFKTAEEAVMKKLYDEEIIKDFFKHLYSRSIADALSKIVGLDDRPFPFYVPLRVEVVKHVANLIDPTSSYETCNNAVYLLLDIIQRSREINAWTELMKALNQRETLHKLIDQLNSPEVHVIKSVVTILVALCNPEVSNSIYKSSEQDEDSTLMKDEEEVPVLIELIIAKVKDLSEILKQSPQGTRLSTFGVALPTLGEGRLKLIELINSLLRIDNSALLGAIAESDIVEVITELFATYKWNSLLHGAFEQLILAVIQSNSNDLKTNLIVKANLPEVLERLVEGEVKYGNGVLMKTGQAGHVTRITNILENAAKTHDYIKHLLESNTRWHLFVENTVNPQNELENRTLGGKQPNSSFRSVTSEDEDLIDIKPERFSSWKYTSQPVDVENELEEEIEDTKGEMTTDELEIDNAFEFKPNDFGTTARFNEDSFKSQAAENNNDQEQDNAVFNSSVYWQITVNTDDLEDLD